MCVQVCFDLFDTKKQDYLSADDLDEIMRAMGFRPSKEELQVLQRPFGTCKNYYEVFIQFWIFKTRTFDIMYAFNVLGIAAISILLGKS
jgi:Ca2+-binding EF-hand superfamily protein